MVKLLMSLEVSDFAKWKISFDAYEGARKSAGLKRIEIFRGAEKPNTIVLLGEWEDLEKARKFYASPELRALQAKSGLVGKPTTYTLQSI
jgi:quinol monooxygenase YgiN